MKEIILNLFTGALENIGETKLEKALQDLHDKNPALYKATVVSGHAFAIALTPYVETTGTKIDDAILKAIGQAISDSAAINGVVLTD